MNVVTNKGIVKMLKLILSENINVVSPDNKEVLVSKGFKLRHIKSGLLYTVLSVDKKQNKFYITAKSGDGQTIVIDQKEFKQYMGA